MFKISIVESPRKRTMLVEGTLILPWTEELRRVGRDVRQGLEGRELVIDLANVTVISQEAENTLFELMRNGAKFSCGGVMTKHVLKQLARRSQNKFRDILTTVREKAAL